jgi:hypothetical protein
MVALRDALSNLSEVSKQLNEESDSVNEIISSVEAAINQANPGVEVWLEEGLPRHPEIDPEDYRKHEDEGGGLYRRFWTLGYARSDTRGEWAIFARLFEYELTEEPAAPEVCPYNATLLADCPRTVRVEAAPWLERLVEEITHRAQEMLEGLREAKKKVDDAKRPRMRGRGQGRES